MERLLTPRELRSILARYGVKCEEARGKAPPTALAGALGGDDSISFRRIS